MRLILLSLALTMTISLPARAEPPRVVADIAPVHALVAMVMDNVADPELLLSPDASPHAASLRPSDARRLSRAQVVIWVGSELTPSLERSLTSLASGAQIISLLDAPATQVLEAREGPLFEADGHEDHDHGHDHGTVDPHAWLSPQNAKAWLTVIADALAAADPDNRAVYAQNAANAAADIDRLEAAIVARLAPVAHLPFLAQHDGTQYFETAFGLTGRGSVASSEGIAPGAARLSRLRAAIADEDIRCILSEPFEGRSLVTSLADDRDMTIAQIDLMAMGADPGPDLYAHLLTAMAEAVADCLTADGST